MADKVNIPVDKVPRGVEINRNGEVNYTADIVISLDSDIEFQYAVVEEGSESAPFIPYSSSKKLIVFKHKNTDGVFRKKILLIKSEEKSQATVSINVERFLSTEQSPSIEQLGPRGRVLLTSGGVQNEDTAPWYKNPWVLGAIVVGVLIIVMSMSSSEKKKPVSSFYV
jgi:hypothetical protein